jgi:predicted outer membrane repeat protein
MLRSIRFPAICLFLCTSLFMAMPAAVHARVTRVPGDVSSLQVAMALAADGDTLRLAPGLYSEPMLNTPQGPSMLVLDRVLTIIGEGEVVLHGGWEGRILYVTDRAAGSHLIGLKFKAGMAWTGGAIHQESVLLHLSACGFDQNGAEHSGGALFSSRGSLAIMACVFDGNHSGGAGGAVSLEDTSVELKACSLVNSDAVLGGGIYVGPGSHAELQSSILVGESADVGGWALVEDGFLYAVNCTFFGIPQDETSGGVELRGDLGSAYIETSILCYSGRTAVSSEREGAAMLLCCNLFGNTGGDWTGVVADQAEVGGNLSQDPGFCELLEGKLNIGKQSPCAPANNPCGELIGALGVDCREEAEVEFETSRSEGR